MAGLKARRWRSADQPGPAAAGTHPGLLRRFGAAGRVRGGRALASLSPYATPAVLRARLAGPEPAAARTLLARGWREHRLFIVLAGVSLLPRLLALLAFRPALFTPDSFGYLGEGVNFLPLDKIRPAGYPLLLRVIEPFHSLALVTTAQHLMGIAVAAVVYGLLRHWGLPGWGATLAAAPTLFDSRQIMMESVIWPDTLYSLLIIAAVALLLSKRVPVVWQCAAAGLLIAWCSVTRGNGPVLILPVLAFLLIRRAGWRAVTAAAAAFALPLLGYMWAFSLSHGSFDTTQTDGLFLWSRTMSFANCAVIKPDPDLLPLCPGRQPHHPAAPPPAWSVSAMLAQRSPADYLWASDVWWRHDNPPGINARNNSLGMRFAVRAIEAQPLAYLRTAGDEVGLTFLATDRSLTYRTMHFSSKPELSVIPGYYLSKLRAYAHTSSNTHPVQPYAYLLELYQLPVYFPGLVLLLVVGWGLAGMLRRRRDWGGPAALPWALAVLGIVVPVMLHEYHYRYAITSVPLACLAAALAFARTRPTAPPQPPVLAPATTHPDRPPATTDPYAPPALPRLGVPAAGSGTGSANPGLPAGVSVPDEATPPGASGPTNP